MPINDNDPTGPDVSPPMPDAHGHAALLLVESLIHGMLARSPITTEDAIEIVSSADSVQVEVAEAADGAGAPMWQSHALLDAIGRSLTVDGESNQPPIRSVPDEGSDRPD